MSIAQLRWAGRFVLTRLLQEAGNIPHEEHLSTLGQHEVYVEQVKNFMLTFEL